MNCIRCEIKRAKIVAMVMQQFNKDAFQIVNNLNRKFGPNYYHVATYEHDTTTHAIMRLNKLPDYTPYHIHTMVVNHDINGNDSISEEI